MEVLMRRSGILVFSREDEMTDITRMNENRLAK
jgi:hypothetical protein